MENKLPLFEGDIDKIKTFVLFAGHPRSGSTLIAAILEAHPNVMMGNEVSILDNKRTKRVQTKKQVLDRIAMNVAQSAHTKWRWGGQSMHIEGQGYYDDILVVGDKKSGLNAMKSNNVWRFKWLEELMGIPLRVISPVRNPRDNIASATIRSRTLRKNTKLYELRCQGVKRLLDAGFPIHFLYLHKITNNPDDELRALADFVGIPYIEDWAERCKEKIWPTPRVTGDQVEWSADDERRVKSIVNSFSWLAPYTP